jgi:excisionase family DNA binding protein
VERINARQTAERFGVAERTVRRWIKAGRLSAIKEGGSFVIDPAEAERIASRRANEHGSQALAMAELRGRYLEAKARVSELEEKLARESARSARLEAGLEKTGWHEALEATG